MDRRSRQMHPTAAATRLADVLPFRAPARRLGDGGRAAELEPDPHFVEGLRLLWADLSTLDTVRRTPPSRPVQLDAEQGTVISLAERRARRAARSVVALDPLDPCG